MFLLGSLAFSLVALAGEPDQALQELVAESESARAWVTGTTPCCPRVVDLQVVRDKAEGVVRPLQVTGRLQRLTGLDLLVDQRLLVRGELPWGGDVLVVGNARTSEQEETIEAYGFGLSPDRRLLVYQTHYPRMVPPAARRSIFLLYDFSKSPQANWIGDGRQEWPHPNVGRPVFPEENVVRQSGDVFLGGSYHVASPFLWSPSSDAIVFLAQLNHEETAEECFLVRIDLTGQGRVEQIRKRPLLDALVDPGFRKTMEEELGEAPFCFGAEHLRWVEETGLRKVVASPYLAFSLPSEIAIDAAW